MTQRDYNKNYYEKNKNELSAKRKAAYRADPERRAKAQLRQARVRREAKERRSDAGEELIYRTIDGVKVQVFRIGAVAKKIGKSVETIRKWESTGIIPLPLPVDRDVSATHRYYTQHQVDLLAKLSAEADKYRYARGTSIRRDTVNKMSQYIAENWALGTTKGDNHGS